jgi:hypothetical protein
MQTTRYRWPAKEHFFRKSLGFFVLISLSVLASPVYAEDPASDQGLPAGVPPVNPEQPGTGTFPQRLETQQRRAQLAPDATEAEAETTTEVLPTPSWVDNLGINYNSFFWGPGPGQPWRIPPALSGAPNDSGLYVFNLVSFKYRLTERFSFDMQLRNQIMFTGSREVWGDSFRHQGQRFGISGTFIRGDDWSFSGALNSDLPIAGLAGQINEERTLIANPGLFSFFNYNPAGSDWSLFVLIAPRMWIYKDRMALSIQDVKQGGAVNKPEYTFWANPSVNRKLTDTLGLRFGTTLEYTKFVGFESARRNYMPFDAGITYDHSRYLSIYTYLYTTTPLDDSLREAQGFGDNSWRDSMSLQIWLSGNLL